MSAHTVPLLQTNPAVVESVADILGLAKPERLVAIDINFGNGLGVAGPAMATIQLLLDEYQLRRLVTVATDHDIEYPT